MHINKINKGNSLPGRFPSELEVSKFIAIKSEPNDKAFVPTEPLLISAMASPLPVVLWYALTGLQVFITVSVAVLIAVICP